MKKYFYQNLNFICSNKSPKFERDGENFFFSFNHFTYDFLYSILLPKNIFKKSSSIKIYKIFISKSPEIWFVILKIRSVALLKLNYHLKFFIKLIIIFDNFNVILLKFNYIIKNLVIFNYCWRFVKKKSWVIQFYRNFNLKSLVIQLF